MSSSVASSNSWSAVSGASSGSTASSSKPSVILSNSSFCFTSNVSYLANQDCQCKETTSKLGKTWFEVR